MPIPTATRAPVSLWVRSPIARWMAIAHRMLPRAVVNETMKLSPWVFTTVPPKVSICLRTMASCSRSTPYAASSPYCSVYSVKPRMSLKRIVTVPLYGTGAAGAASAVPGLFSLRASGSMWRYDTTPTPPAEAGSDRRRRGGAPRRPRPAPIYGRRGGP